MKTNKEQIRKNRITALEVLYQMEFQDTQKSENTSPLASAICNKKNEIDEILNKYSENWKLSRMALMDLNILRLATYEILFTNTTDSPKIFINEAIELAKLYGSADSFKFVNGILDSIAKKERKWNV